MTTTDQQTGMKPYVVHTVGDASETVQTPGMVRQPAIVPGKGDTTKIWMGKVTAAPREKGPPHTHLEAETAAYVLKGHVRVYFGENFEEWIEAARPPATSSSCRPHNPRTLRRIRTHEEQEGILCPAEPNGQQPCRGEPPPVAWPRAWNAAILTHRAQTLVPLPGQHKRVRRLACLAPTFCARGTSIVFDRHRNMVNNHRARLPTPRTTATGALTVKTEEESRWRTSR